MENQPKIRRNVKSMLASKFSRNFNMSMFGLPRMQDYLIGGKYRLIKRLGAGSFGTIFMGIDKDTKQKVAIKMEETTTMSQQLLLEYKIHSMLSCTYGFPHVHYYGTDENYNVMVMDLLGPSLEDCFVYCNRKFSLKTNLMLMDQMLMRIELVHKKSFIHRDIKPDNFLMGTGDSSHRLYLIDFGLAARYCDPVTKVHVPLTYTGCVVGTTRYISLNAHRAMQQSRRDDMISIGYVIMYFNRGHLPWQRQRASTRKQHMEKIFEIKRSTTIEELCDGYPVEFYFYFKHCYNLNFDDEPDYLHLRRLFRILFRSYRFEYDYRYEWRLAVLGFSEKRRKDKEARIIAAAKRRFISSSFMKRVHLAD